MYSFVYDEENRLRSATGAGNTVSYEYDGLGRRRQKTVNGLTTRYLLDGDEEIGEYSGSNALQVRYIYGPAIDDRVAMVTAAGAKSWYHANHQLSTVMLTNASGNVSGSYKYLPFGESPALSTGNPYGYTGRRYDPETGLYYYRARYYSTTLGRFLQTDPAGYRDDLNLYAYVGGDPLAFVDQTGEGKKWVGWLVRLSGDASKKMAKVTKEQAVRLRRQGENIQARTRQKARQIEVAAHGEENLIRHAAHDVDKGFRPHFQTKGRLGHTFWSIAAVGIGLAAGALDATADAADSIGDTLENSAEGVSEIASLADPIGLLTSGDSAPPPGFREGPLGLWIREDSNGLGQSEVGEKEKVFCTGSRIARESC